jgi:hypothetical protein
VSRPIIAPAAFAVQEKSFPLFSVSNKQLIFRIYPHIEQTNTFCRTSTARFHIAGKSRQIGTARLALPRKLLSIAWVMNNDPNTVVGADLADIAVAA